MKLFIIHTWHRNYEEYDPYIVVANDKEEASKLVEETTDFQKDKKRRLIAYVPAKRVGIKKIKEINLNKSQVVWTVFNPG